MPTGIERNKVKELMAAGGQLVEVLPSKEYNEEHLPDAVNIPLKELTRETVDGLDTRRAVIVYCWDYQCDLSPRSAWRLETLGFEEVYDYLAGKADWLAAGLPTEGESASVARAGAYAHRDVLTCDLGESPTAVLERMQIEDDEVCIVINSDGIVLGRLWRKDLSAADEFTIEEVMESGPSTFRPSVTLEEMAEYMRKHSMDSALITTNDGVLVGTLDADAATAPRQAQEFVPSGKGG